MLREPWVVAVLLFVISAVIGLIFFAVVEFLNLGSTSLSSISGLIGAMIVGQVYVGCFKEVMPKKVRKKVAMIYLAIQIVLGFLYGLILRPELVLDSRDLLFFSGLLVVIAILYSLAVYWMLGLGGKSYLKALEKREAAGKDKN